MFQKRAESIQITGSTANKLSFPADSVLACALRAVKGRVRRKLSQAGQKILLSGKNPWRYPRLLCQDTCRLKPLSPGAQGKPPPAPAEQGFILGIWKEIGHLPFKNITSCSRTWWVKTGNICTFLFKVVFKPVAFYPPIRSEHRALQR